MSTWVEDTGYMVHRACLMMLQRWDSAVRLSYHDSKAPTMTSQRCLHQRHTNTASKSLQIFARATGYDSVECLQQADETVDHARKGLISAERIPWSSLQRIHSTQDHV